ncbi:hypothetical protein NQ317_002797 [Molorchus minor]|uniref:Uncharacterized protein n=1 Tax=Molorchus minor TaxID=1323400 RepID=A0ABQ9J748_9CUCU|nr:hypothetical protein NQ317_002797 [Molorchus minor]
MWSSKYAPNGAVPRATFITLVAERHTGAINGAILRNIERFSTSIPATTIGILLFWDPSELNQQSSQRQWLYFDLPWQLLNTINMTVFMIVFQDGPRDRRKTIETAKLEKYTVKLLQ